MPRLRGATVTLHTPLALEGLPETVLPTITKPDGTNEDVSNCASIIVPTHIQSLFWLSYSTQAPIDDTFYVFKLFVNQEHIVTWCCGEKQQWKGKVQFTLLSKGSHDRSRHHEGMEKRALQFGNHMPDNDGDRCVEVRMFRAKTKVRIPRKTTDEIEVSTGDGICLPEAGLTKRGHPRTFYKFGLIDPKDDPYSTFRFYYRSQEPIRTRQQQHARQVGTDRNPTRDSQKAILKPLPKGKLTTAREVKVSRLPRAMQRTVVPKPTAPAPAHTICLPPTPLHSSALMQRSTGDVNLRRLSIPPSTILRPLLENRPLPATPTKKPGQITDVRSKSQQGELLKENGVGMFRSLFHHRQ